ARHQGVPRALRARRAGLGGERAAPVRARPLTAMAARVEPVAVTLPVVAIVGPPNVGKSTLFNRIVGQPRAIVYGAPGGTRGRVVAPAVHDGRAFLCVDPGGFLAEKPRDPTAIEAQVRAQALAAIDEAQALLCVVDGYAGLAPVDRDTVRLLAR